MHLAPTVPNQGHEEEEEEEEENNFKKITSGLFLPGPRLFISPVGIHQQTQTSTMNI